MARQDNSSNPDRTGRRPTPVAVALQYQPDAKAAPRVVASGRGRLAERIVELAFASGIKVREDADLAEILTAVDIGEQIPMAAFSAVAEILFYVMRANQQQSAASENHP